MIVFELLLALILLVVILVPVVIYMAIIQGILLVRKIADNLREFKLMLDYKIVPLVSGKFN
ncbi:MAG: hypothetical protein LBN43_00930 [Oscillospiraceae bacterium]|nr:hypothetical protein [Oscillospiraceae bacterium]